jgi:predicted amidohydrolase YtcJ
MWMDNSVRQGIMKPMLAKDASRHLLALRRELAAFGRESAAFVIRSRMTRCNLIPVVGFMLMILFQTATGGQSTFASLVLVNGKIVTVDGDQPEAQAVAIQGDMIVAVGSNYQIRAYCGPRTRMIDLQGNLAIPGFIEGHGHFLHLGSSKMELDLSKARTWDGIVTMVKEAAQEARPGEWIIGDGWHQEKWDTIPRPDIEGYPTHELLSEASPHNPVLLRHASGHAILVNAIAMERAGITKLTTDPAGGRILRLANGDPAGVFIDTAGDAIEKALEKDKGNRAPGQIEGEKRRAVELAVRDCLSKGVTSFQDAGTTFDDITLFRKLAEEGKLGIRLWVMITESNERLEECLPEYKIVNFGNKRLTVRAIKCLMDGALGSRSAWLLEPYSDLPSSTGLNTISIESLRETARLAIENGFQLCTHAIGDRANREVLNVYELTMKEHPESVDLRWRIEHAQHVAASDISRFGELGVIAAMQTVHCTSDGPWVIERIGENRAREGAYAWQKLMKSGAIVANGTDAPVEDVDPIANFYAAITRMLPNDTLFYPEERMTREQALKSYTMNCAYAAFEEDIKGSITSGKLADIVILSKDIMTIPEQEIPETKVVYTILGGEIVYQGGPLYER